MSPRDTLGAALRLVAGLALVFGVPAALVAGVGWPLPREIPSLDAIREALLRQGVPVEVMMKALAVIVWLAWAQLTVALVVETAAAIKGRQARRAPLVPGIQQLAGQIVASSALLVSLLGPLRSTVTDPGQPIEIARLELVAGGHTLALPAAAASEPAAASDTDEGGYVVQRGDSYWAIARRELGDGMRWREIRDRNVGRVMPDGHTITADDTDLRPGWRIELPAAARAAANTSTVPPAVSAAAEDAYVVQPGDHFWSIAEHLLSDQLGRVPTDAEIVPYWQRLVAANEDRIRSGDADLIYPGEVFTTAVDKPPEAPSMEDSQPPAADPPSGTGESPTETPDPPQHEAGTGDEAEPGGANGGERHGPEAPPDAAPHEPAAPNGHERQHTPPAALPEPGDEADADAAVPPTTRAPASEPRTAAPQSEGDANSATNGADDGGKAGTAVPLLLGAAGSTVLAVALARRWRHKRARRAARLSFDAMPPPPPPEAQPVQHELLRTADEDAADRLDAALAHMADGLRPQSGQPCPLPRLVQLADARVDVLLDRPEPSPPAGWRSEASGLIWVLDADVEVPASNTPSPLPALVTIGVGDATILVDLEAHGVVALCGDPVGCAGLARSMAVELAARSEGSVPVEIVAPAPLATLGDLDGVRVVPDWDHIDTGFVEATAGVLDAGRWPHTFAARASGRAYDALTPSVTIATGSDHPSYRQLLDTATRRVGAGTAVVVVGSDPGAGLRIDVDDQARFVIPELDLSGAVQTLADDTTEAIMSLLGDEDDDDELAVPEPEFVVDVSPPAATAAGDGPEHEPAVSTAPEDSPARCLAGVDPNGYAEPAYNVLVRVCGDISVEGGTQPLAPVAVAVTTYIALNGDSDLDTVRDVVWGRPDVERKTLRNVTSAVRQSLGNAVVYDRGRLAPGEGLIADIELIRRRLDHVRHQTDPAQGAATLRGALEWVTGRVCGYPRKWKRFWAWIEIDHPSWISYVDSLVGAVACDLARLYLDLGDGTNACWAARRGLTGTGPREELTLLFVAGSELVGDEVAAADALRTHEKAMEQLGGLDHSPEMLAALERYQPRMRWGRAS